MLFVVLSALCSVFVGVLLKLMPKWNIDTAYSVNINYLVAIGLNLLLLQPNINQWQQLPVFSTIILGVLLPSLFLVLGYCVRIAGIIRTDVAQRLSFIIPLITAFILFGQAFSFIKGIGIFIGILAVIGIIYRPRKIIQTHSTQTTLQQKLVWILPLMVWMGFAIVDILLKHISQSGAKTPLILLIAFSLAFIFMAIMQIFRYLKYNVILNKNSIFGGIILGILNFFNICFYIRAHQTLPDNPALIFMSMNMLVIILGTFIGKFLFKETLSKINYMAILLALLAVYLLQ